jgi:predicted transposase YbfD/YdcC
MRKEFSDDLPCDAAAFQSVAIVECFSGLGDPRQAGKVVYPLVEVMILVLLAVMAGADAFTEIERFGKVKMHLLRRFAPFANGTPPHDTLGDIFAALDFEAFQRCFAAWAARFVGIPEGVVAIDGKTARRTHKKAKGEAAIHMVTAYAVERRLVLGQVKTEQKSNEITAIPKLLDALSLAGATVTIDAMGCQREIAAKIIDKGADYILALKDNQPRLAEDVRVFDVEQSAADFADTRVDQTETVDGDHGRIETRKVTVYQDVAWLQERHAWPGLKSVIKVESRREIGTKVETDTRYYLASAILTAIFAAAFVRAHWGIENSLHWVLDVVMRDDDSRVRTGNAGANLGIVKHIAYNLIKRGKGKHSFRAKRKLAAWDDTYLIGLLAP